MLWKQVDFSSLHFTSKIKNSIDLLLVIDENNVLTEHKNVCLSIIGAQSVRLEKGTIKFKNYFKQIPVPFKIYADFKCNLENAESYEGSYS